MHNQIAALANRRGIRQFVKFGIVGSSGLVINFVIAHVLQRSTTFSEFADFAIGFMAGGVSNYILNRIWTFRSERHPLIEGLQFLLVSLIALGCGKIVFGLAERYNFHHFSTLWLISTLGGVFINFFLNKYWTFKHVS